MAETQRSTAVILFIFLTLIWGTSFILIKQGLKVFSPDEVGALRVAAASMFLLPIALMRLKELKLHHFWQLFASGMMGIFIPAFLFATAQTKMDSSVAGILNTLTPIFTVMLSAVVFNQRFKPMAIVGLVLGLCGTVLLSLSRHRGAVVGFNEFAILIVIACFLYASNINFVKFKIQNVSALTITSVSVMLIGPLAFIYLFGFTDFTYRLETHEGAKQALVYVVILGLMSTAVATILFNWLVKISTPLFTSSVTYVIPIVAVMWGILDGEKLQLGHFIGMATIIVGVYIANRK